MQELLAGDVVKTKTLIEALPAALDLPKDVIQGAIQVTQQQLDGRERQRQAAQDAAYRHDFKPHAIILTERTRPLPFFVAAIIGVERLLRVDFHETANPITFFHLALGGLKVKLAEWRSDQLPAFGRPTGIAVNYTPDFSVRFDLSGTPLEISHSAYRVAQVHLSIKHRPIPGGVLPTVSSSAQDG